MKGIYIIVNKANGKFYLGSTINYEKRKSQHLGKLRKNKHHSIKLQRAYNKYGKDNFYFELIEECENIHEREQQFLNSINVNENYNISKFAHGGDRICGHPNEKEIRLKIKATNDILRPKKIKVYKGLPDITKERNPNWKGGKTFCLCGNRISSIALTCINCQDKTGSKNPFFGKSHSEEFKENLRKQRLGKYNGNQEKIVIAEGIEYKSLSSAAKFYKVVPATILNRIKSKNYPNYYYKEI